MTLKQLEYFNAISIFGSITRAAAAIGVSAPTITYSIRQFEEEVGVPLYNNGYRYTEMTREGKAILEHVKEIMNDYHSFTLGLDALRRGKNHIIKFAFYLGDDIPRRVISDFNVQNPDIEIKIEQNNAHLISTGVGSKEYDIGLTASIAVDGGMTTIPYGGVEFGILCSDTHPLAQYEIVTPEHLSHCVIAVPEFDSPVEDSLEKYLAKHKISVSILRLPCGVYAKNAVLFRREVASVFPVTEELLSGFSFRRLSPPLYMQQSLIWRKDLYLDKDILEFMAFLSSIRDKEF